MAYFKARNPKPKLLLKPRSRKPYSLNFYTIPFSKSATAFAEQSMVCKSRTFAWELQVLESSLGLEKVSAGFKV